ncbi:cell division protein FtsK [Caballeronia hypogeia]|uniref:Cell division protein FtsK n=1 Tax=Caballeronia hypogeia TaxID=1777140 RepID=A0A157ZVD0_9BURK|nr:DNA translocase FtsK [Caballeronia hypogeia]SAK49492.1 cell division protein FtsK [Caballeronia hypogeia]
MHMVVLGWFGASVVWFLPLIWRIVKLVLPGGDGLRGPGTIRLWLGFLAVLLASSTLEGALAGSFETQANINLCGRALAGALSGLAHPSGAGVIAALVLAVFLPWLIEFSWRSVLAWADEAFGFGLPQSWITPRERQRDTEPRPAKERREKSRDRLAGWFERRARASAARDSGERGLRSERNERGDAPPSRSLPDEPTLGLPAGPRSSRYQRPTVWRPPSVSKGNASRAAAAGADAVATAEAYAKRPAYEAAGVAPPVTQTEPVPPAGWLNPGFDTAARDNRAHFPPRQASAFTPSGSGLRASVAVEPTVPPARKAPMAEPRAERPRSSATSMPASRATGVASTTASVATGAIGATGARTVGRPTSPQTPPGIVRRPPVRPAVNSAAREFAPAPLAAPAFSRPATPPGPPTPPPAPESIQATLRSIEEKTALWTSLAGASLARGHVAMAKSAQPDVAVAPSPTPSPIVEADASPIIEAVVEVEPTYATPEPIVQQSEPSVPASAADEPVINERDERIEAPVIDAHTIAPALVEPPPLFAMPQFGATLSAIAPAAPAVPATIKPIEPLAPATSDEAKPADSAPVEAAQKPEIFEEPEVAPTPRIAMPSEPPLPVSSTSATSAPQAPRNVRDLTQIPPWLDAIAAREHANQPPAPPLPAIVDEQETELETQENEAEPVAEPQAAVDELAPPSNIVRFPVASSAPVAPLAPAPVCAPADSRAALRGSAPTEFEFHAPHASAVELPTLDLLEPASGEVEPVPEERLLETGQLIEQRLQEFKVPVTVVGASAGPVITRFEVEPALGVRGSQIVGLMKDLSRGLGLTSIRVVETIPGKTCMGLELPNPKRQMIRLSEILEADVYRHSKSNLTIAMGKDIIGNPVVTDLAKAPHMLVAGTTGSGKSVAINAMILSLLYKAKPEDVRLIMIDPKMLELSVYEGIPHLLAPVVTDMKLASNALNWCVGEMEKRYRLMSAVGVRNLQGFNQKIRNTEAAGKKLTNPFSLTPDAPEPLSTLPLIVVVIDELADLMMVAGKQIEQLIARLAQKARAAGIHLILATQRPSVDVITGLIKANIPTRVAFQVSSKIDSRTILDQMGAESLLGAGDMLFLPPGTGYPQRVHGAFVADDEVHRVVEHLKQFGEPEYEEGILSGPTSEGGATGDLFGDSPDAEADPLYDEAVAFVVRTRRASISSVQRQLRIGYNRAARLVEQMESAGLVSPMGSNGNREVLAPPGPAE